MILYTNPCYSLEDSFKRGYKFYASFHHFMFFKKLPHTCSSATSVVMAYSVGILLVVSCVHQVLGARGNNCPLGFLFNNSTSQCDCRGPFTQTIPVKCDENEKRVYIPKGVCLTSMEEKGAFYIGDCPLTLRNRKNNTDRMWSELPRYSEDLNTTMCGPYNREGLLCGECIDGYGFPACSPSLKCVNCSKMSLRRRICLYLFIQFAPITFLFVCVIIFRVNVTTGPLLGYILFFQFYHGDKTQFQYIVSYIREYALKILFTISQSLSELLAMFPFTSLIPPFCISEKLRIIDIQMLTIVPALYVVLLFITVCILVHLHAQNCRVVLFLWKPFEHMITINGDSIMHGFATCVFLSSTSIISNFSALLPKAHVFFSFNNTLYKSVLYIDPTVVYVSHTHSMYLLIALVPCLFLVLVPALLLIIYPTRIYRRLSRCISARKQLAITAFAEALHGCFKDGLNGTTDYRTLAGLVILALPLVSLTTYATWRAMLTLFDRAYITVFLMFILSLAVSYVRPCKSFVANLSLSYHFTMLGILKTGVKIWTTDFLTGTEILELVFIIIPFMSHCLALTWGGFIAIRYVRRRIRARCPLCCLRRISRRELANLTRCWKYGGYQALTDPTSP